MEADTSIRRKTGHFYFALTPFHIFGIGRVHRYPLAELKCASPKR